MQTNTGVLRNIFDGFGINWKHLCSWREKTLTREKLAGFLLMASTGTVLGYIIWCTAKAMQNYTVLGLG